MANEVKKPEAEEKANEPLEFETIELAENAMDEYGCIIKPISEIITTKQPEAETAEETTEK